MDLHAYTLALLCNSAFSSCRCYDYGLRSPTQQVWGVLVGFGGPSGCGVPILDYWLGEGVYCQAMARSGILACCVSAVPGMGRAADGGGDALPLRS